MQNIVTKLLVIFGVLALCLLSIGYKDLRLGKDLRGGVSMTYQVRLDEAAANPQAMLEQTISVLKERVNPKGVFDISMQPMGRDRIEVVMPLPNDEVRALSASFEAALESLVDAAEIRSVELDDALVRGDAAGIIGGTGDRSSQLELLQAAYDARAEARAAFSAARAAGASDSEIDLLAGTTAEAEIEFEKQYDDVLRMSLSEARVRRTLGLSTDPVPVVDEAGAQVRDETGALVMGPSARQTALELLEAEFPHASAALMDVIARYDEYQSKRKGFDDPEDLIRLLRGAGVLEFRIAVTAADNDVDVAGLREELVKNGPENTTDPKAKWFPINQLRQWADKAEAMESLQRDPALYFQSVFGLVAAEHEGQYYLLLFDTDPKALTHERGSPWTITQAFPTVDQLGRPAVAFNLDSSGGARMGRLTATNINKPMAIVLDGEIYSAPNINSQITQSGTIVGSFTQDEINYLIRVLAAGALQARLSPDPIAVNTLGPSIGQENLVKGREAFIISIIAVAVFMLGYYFFAGLVADIALLINGIVIFGVMMGIDATFTLPGLAGIVLTVGMAVDANVLIYERIREEMFAGELDLRGCVREGYRKALSTILDANITNLIVCLVLFKTATTEVKGFALTLTFGICATLFTALFVTRQIFFLYTDVFKARKLSMLATVVPAIHRTLEPTIDWISLRKIFWAISGTAVVISLLLVGQRGVDMFDTELRGGISLTMLTARTTSADETGDGERLLLAHTGEGGVESRVRSIAEGVEDPEAASDRQEFVRRAVLQQFASASVLTSGETQLLDGRLVGDAFQVKVANPAGLEEDDTITEVIVEALIEEFGDELDATPPLTFAGLGDDEPGDRAMPVTDAELGANIDRPDATQRVPDMMGGVAILLENVSPPTTAEDVLNRIERMRKQPDFARYAARDARVFGLDPADPSDPSAGYTSLVVLVRDEYRQYEDIDSIVFVNDVAVPEWRLVTSALAQPSSFEQVSVFSSAVASTLSAQAVVAVALSLLGILVYIWVRFGSLRYSLAAIAALVHDVTISLGLLALSGVVGGTALGAMLLVEPFRIDLGVVAALLTIIGYSLNDTIVILDRIRENRGKLPLPTAPIVNRSINQTLSRTLLTSVTTLMAVAIMYAEGGSGIRPFTYVLLAGLLVGTYSSIAIAAPLVITTSGIGRKGTDLPIEPVGEATGG